VKGDDYMSNSNSIAILNETINELRKIEPYWSCCFPCNNEGKCCIGADVAIYPSEWNIIENQIIHFSDSEKAVLLSNIKLKRHCVFRSKEKCLIHDVRPLNCRYTPFQYAITPDNYLHYAMMSRNCNFQTIREKLEESTANRLRNLKFARLANFDTQSWYLSLNYLAASENIPLRGAVLASEWIRSRCSLLMKS